MHELLDKYANMAAQVDVMNMHFDKLRNEALPPEIVEVLEGIEVERKASLEAIQEGMEEVKKEIVTLVKKHGATVKGSHYQAVYSLRTSWDTKKLTGYAAAHPEILAFQKLTKSVALKKNR